MPRDSLFLVLCSSLALACTKPGDPPPASTTAAEIEAPSEPAAAEIEAPSKPAAGPRFWVAGGGLHAYDLNGTMLASLGDRGDSARRLADGRIVVVAETPLGARLSVLDAAGKPGLELELPTVLDDSCAMAVNVLEKGDDGEEFLAQDALAMQSDRDFAINAAGTHACISLLDRNTNMSDYEVDLAVDLATGKVESAVSLDLTDQCPQTTLAVCSERASMQAWAEEIEPVAAKSWKHTYNDETGVLSSAGKPVRELCVPKADRHGEWNPSDGGCVSTEEVSSSGRWLLVSAMNDMGGDYIYRLMYLLDLETGGLSTLMCEGETPCTMQAVRPEQLFVGDEPPGYSVVGETEIGSLPGDRFWVDGRLLIPADAKVVEIGGTVAQSVGQ